MEIKSNICAGIVTFNPDIDLLKKNIDSIIRQVKQVVVFDNGSNNIDLIKNLLDEYNTVILIEGKNNLGIAFALNRLCEWADNKNYEWILTLDQDSIASKNLVNKLSKYSKNNIAVVAPNIVYKGNEKYTLHCEKKFEEVDWVITSASLTNVRVWGKLNGFDEWLFIDGVDYDYGVRANIGGYKIIRTYETALWHELGNLKCIRILGKTIYVTNHSALRKYYMSRNTIYLRHKLQRGNPIITIIKYVLKTIFFEDNKMEKMASIIYGVSDGIKSIRGGVIVIISTYNGEEYIREQLDSVLNQVGVQVDILIRDDGSTDLTKDILQEYNDKFSNVSYYTGENIGVVASFNNLMMRSELDNYEYIAFCDQDDIWNQDKLLIAVSNIEEEQVYPVVYCSNLLLVDKYLNKLKLMRNSIKKYTGHMALVQNIGTGCTQVFNRKALELYRKGINCRIEMHDYWMTLLCMFMGKIIYDENSHISYRQHGNNVIGAKNKNLNSAIHHIRNQMHEVRVPMLEDFMRVYGDYINDDKCILEIINYKKSIFSRIRLLSIKYRGLSSKVTIGFKVRACLGKMY